MNRLMVGVAILGMIAGTTTSGFAQKGKKVRDSVEEFGWLTSFEAAKQQAANTKKPIMLVFRCVP